MLTKFQSTAARALSLALIAVLAYGSWAPVLASGDESSERANSKVETPLLKGQVQFCVPHGTPMKLKIATVPTSGLDLLNKDIEGHLLPAHLNDEITAKVSEDMYVDDNKVIPQGTVFHGKVTKILPPRRAGRPGSLMISFDQLRTPDGRRFAFHAQADNQHASTNASKAKGFGRIAAYAGGGAFVGAMVAYQLFGLHETIAMHGWNIVGGAGGGALLASGYALMKKGRAASLEPGEDLNMELDADLLMPVAVEPRAKPKAVNVSGLDITVKKTKLLKDGLDGNMLRMDVAIVNDSDRLFKSIDLYLEDANGTRYPVCAGSDDESEYIFEVEPHSRLNTRVFFQVTWPKLKRSLVWLNHHSRQVCYRTNCP